VATILSANVRYFWDVTQELSQKGFALKFSKRPTLFGLGMLFLIFFTFSSFCDRVSYLFFAEYIENRRGTHYIIFNLGFFRKLGIGFG